MDVLFVTHDLGYTDNIAIAFLSAVAKQLGHSTYYCSLDRDNFNYKIKTIKPRVVAYSVNSYGYKKTIWAHKQALEKQNFISIMGGPHPTVSPETFRESRMDAYCIGEGEYAFRDFLNRVENGDSFDDILNLVTKNRSNSVRPLIDPLDQLPMPDRDLVFSNSFHKYTSKKTFFASRGCPFNCSYCCNSYYHKLYPGKILRRFTVDRVLREIEDVKKKYKMDFVKFDDDCFTLNADKWLEEFAEKYPERIGMPFNCVLRFDALNDDILRLLKKAGCFSLVLSVDSASNVVREKVLNRRMRLRNADIVKKLKRIQDYGINTWVNYMVGAPESTVRDDLATITISKKARVTYPSYTTAVPMEKTRLYDYCIKKGYIKHYSDMPSFYGKSPLSCFTKYEKNIQFNVNLLGAIVSKLPFPLDKATMGMMLIVPPNPFFKKLREFFLNYYIRNKIYNIYDDMKL